MLYDIFHKYDVFFVWKQRNDYVGLLKKTFYVIKRTIFCCCFRVFDIFKLKATFFFFSGVLAGVTVVSSGLIEGIPLKDNMSKPLKGRYVKITLQDSEFAQKFWPKFGGNHYSIFFNVNYLAFGRFNFNI